MDYVSVFSDGNEFFVQHAAKGQMRYPAGTQFIALFEGDDTEWPKPLEDAEALAKSLNCMTSGQAAEFIADLRRTRR